MRRITSHYIYRGEGLPVKYGIITVNDGVIVDISPSADRLVETASTEFYPGVIIPGLVGVDTGTDPSIWAPLTDEEVRNVLESQQTLPIFAAITPHNVEMVSEKAWEAILAKEIMLVLGDTPNHQVHLFRLLQKMAARIKALTFEQLVAIGAVNGAAANQQKSKGTIAPHRNPGLNQVACFNFRQNNIDQHSQINVLIG